MPKNVQLFNKLKELLRANPDLTWQSDSSGEAISVCRYQADTVKFWTQYEEKDGEAEKRLRNQSEAVPTEAMATLMGLFFVEDTLVSYIKPGKSDGESTLYVLVYFKDYFVGLKTKIIHT